MHKELETHIYCTIWDCPDFLDALKQTECPINFIEETNIGGKQYFLHKYEYIYGEDIEEELEIYLARFLPYQYFFSKYSPQFEIAVYLRRRCEGPCFYLSQKTLKSLVELNASIDFDLYAMPRFKKDKILLDTEN